MSQGTRERVCGTGQVTGAEGETDTSNGLEYTYLGRVEADDVSIISFLDSF